MDDPGIRFAHDALALVSTAERVQQGAGDRASAPFLPVALERIEQALHALSRGCDSAAHALIPPGDRHESISWRYARAAADWPGAFDEARPPSHERQAQLLASIHESAAALRTAAACCARTSHLVAETMEAPASIPGFEDRHARPKAA